MCTFTLNMFFFLGYTFLLLIACIAFCNKSGQRGNICLTCSFLSLQAAIRKELNEFKSTEMEVHELSRHLTRLVLITKIHMDGTFSAACFT